MLRGGVPRVFKAAITAVRKHDFPFICNYLKIRVRTNPCRMYFTEADATNDVNYVWIPVLTIDTPDGEWEGPVEARQVWLKSDDGTVTTNVELVVFQRRG